MNAADRILRLLAAEAARQVGRGGARARLAQAAHRRLADLRRRVAVDAEAAALVDDVLRAALAVVGPTLRARRRTTDNLVAGSVPRFTDAEIAAAMRRSRNRKEAAHRLGCSLSTLSRRLARC